MFFFSYNLFFYKIEIKKKTYGSGRNQKLYPTNPFFNNNTIYKLLKRKKLTPKSSVLYLPTLLSS